MRPKKGVGIFRPFRALIETSVILSIGRCPMLMALSPLGSKIGEFISIIVRYWIFAVCCWKQIIAGCRTGRVLLF